ncbi:hypothetical protein [Nitrosospira multiformis]|uniref:hypothetical protein n=1 Tax=Nitrosospira multiformis TaxID=1231 RepID=UPI00094533FC|nr:hypothetical protein [Nitrosospira multiformis]
MDPDVIEESMHLAVIPGRASEWRARARCWYNPDELSGAGVVIRIPRLSLRLRAFTLQAFIGLKIYSTLFLAETRLYFLKQGCHG